MSGLTGHIDHLYEDPNLKLEDIVKIYRTIAKNSSDMRIYEKVDGYNIYLSYSVKDKKARLLRNNSQIKSGGITLADLKEEFVSKRLEANKKQVPNNVVKAYSDLIEFFEKVVSNVFTNDQDKELVFGGNVDGNPQYFFNAEIIDPAAPNVIKYSRKMLIFHRLGNIKINSTTGEIEATDNDEINMRFENLKKIFGKSNADNGIEITEDKETRIDRLDKNNLERELSALREEFKKYDLDMNDSVGKFMIKSVEAYLKREKLEFDSFETEFITKSILAVGFGSKHLKKPSLNDTMPRPDAPKAAKLKKLTNEEPAKKIFASLRLPIEKIIFDCSSILLDRYESVYVTDNKHTEEDIIKLINNAITNINARGTDQQKTRLTKQLDKLKNAAISFTDLINNPIEGIVFRYRNHTYKITSSFGPVNQILHINKFEMGSLNESKVTPANGMKVLFAGAFKPPHRGHIEVIKNFLRLPKLSDENFSVEKVIVIMSDKSRYSKTNQEFDLEQSMKLFHLYLKAANLDSLVELRITKRGNPVKDVYDYIANEHNDKDKAQPGDVILLGASAKDKGYYSNLAKFVKDKPWRILFGEDYEIPMVYKDSPQGEQDILGEYASTELRNAVSSNNMKAIDSYLPQEVLEDELYKRKAYDILGVNEEVGSLKESSLIQLIHKEMQKPAKQSTKLNLGDLINRVNSIYNK